VPDDSDEDRFVTAGQVAAYGMFVGLPSVEELERFFFLALSASFHKLTRQGYPYTYRSIEVQYGRGGLKNLVDVTTERVVDPLVRQTYNSCASYSRGSVTTTWSNSRPFISSGRAMIRDSG
jgi:hypothetical protein